MAAHISRRALNPGGHARRFVLGLLLLVLSGQPSSLTAQTSISSHAADTSPVLLYSPASNLERSEMEMLGRAKISIDIAMYSFTDRELAEELARLARSGVRVRVYRDNAQFEQESQRGMSTTEILLAARRRGQSESLERPDAPQELRDRWRSATDWIRELVPDRAEAAG